MELEKENMDNLLPENEGQKKKKTRLLIAIASIIIIFIIIVIIIFSVRNNGEDKDQRDQKKDEVPKPDYKFTSIETVTLPEGITYESHAIYSKTGHILFLYKMENDTNNTYIGVMDEDGSNLKKLWRGEWKNYYGNKEME